MQRATAPSRFRRVWIAPAWLLLGVARLAIVALPFAQVARWCGRDAGPAAWLPLLAPRQRGRARQVRDVVEAAARHTPWRSDCFPQALVAAALLRTYGVPHALCLGVAPAADRSLKAHAWVDAGGVAVAGGAGFAAFSVVACFIHGRG